MVELSGLERTLSGVPESIDDDEDQKLPAVSIDKLKERYPDFASVVFGDAYRAVQMKAYSELLKQTEGDDFYVVDVKGNRVAILNREGNIQISNNISNSSKFRMLYLMFSPRDYTGYA